MKTKYLKYIRYIFKTFSFSLISVVLVIFVIGYAYLEHRGVIGETDMYMVQRVIDGDTIYVTKTGDLDQKNIIKVRLLGINAPEVKHQGNETTECFGNEAKDFLTETVLGRKVRLESDTQKQDIYNRELRFVYLGDEMINTFMLENGMAYKLFIPPNRSYELEFDMALEYAKSNLYGVWTYCYLDDKRAK